MKKINKGTFTSLVLVLSLLLSLAAPLFAVSAAPLAELKENLDNDGDGKINYFAIGSAAAAGAGGGDAAKTRQRRAATEIEDHRFKIVIGVVRRGKKRNIVFNHYPIKIFVSHVTGGGLKALASLCRDPRKICPKNKELNAETVAYASAKILVSVCLLSAYSVIYVGGVYGRAACIGISLQHVQESRGVRAA